MTDPQATPCAFCEIIAGHAPAHVTWTDENAVVFLDRNPITPGHLLIIPRRRLCKPSSRTTNRVAATQRARTSVPDELLWASPTSGGAARIQSAAHLTRADVPGPGHNQANTNSDVHEAKPAAPVPIPGARRARGRPRFPTKPLQDRIGSRHSYRVGSGATKHYSREQSLRWWSVIT